MAVLAQFYFGGSTSLIGNGGSGAVLFWSTSSSGAAVLAQFYFGAVLARLV